MYAIFVEFLTVFWLLICRQVFNFNLIIYFESWSQYLQNDTKYVSLSLLVHKIINIKVVASRILLDFTTIFIQMWNHCNSWLNIIVIIIMYQQNSKIEFILFKDGHISILILHSKKKLVDKLVKSLVINYICFHFDNIFLARTFV